MTHIILLTNPQLCAAITSHDPRPPREVMAAINTGQARIGEDQAVMRAFRQSAMLHPPLPVVTVVLEPPPVYLTERQYRVLFGLADGKPAAQIAEELGVRPRTVFKEITAIKLRFGAQTREGVLAAAQEFGLIE